MFEKDNEVRSRSGLFPVQKKLYSEKTTSWREECVDSIINTILGDSDYVRSLRLNKKINSDLLAGILNKKDLKRFIDPYDLDGQDLNEINIPNHQLIFPRIQALKGKEYKRKFNFKVAIIDDDSISQKEEQERDVVISFINSEIAELAQTGQIDENKIQQKLAQLQDYLNYDMQDLREISANALLKYYFKYLKLRELYNDGWEDALCYGEELYCVEEFNNEPSVRKVNPKNTWYIITGNSSKIDDCDAVIEEYWLPFGKVIDQYYEYLTPSQIDDLENKLDVYSNALNSRPDISYSTLVSTQTMLPDELAALNYDNIYDYNGGVKIFHVRWKSLKKIGILSYLDEAGEPQTKMVSETFKLTPEEKQLGWTVKWHWINEAWEGTKIGKDIYVKIQPRKIQFRKKDNLSYCNLGYYGNVYNSTDNKVQSYVDIMKPYQYKYITIWYRIDEALRKSFGKIGFIPTHLIPDGWSEDLWLHYATKMGFAPIDAFKESNKGAMQGRSAGQLTGMPDGLDMDQMQYINQHLEMLRQIENELSFITGLPPEALGIVESDQGLGTYELAQQNVNSIVEPLFKKHDDLKLRVLEGVLETAKYCIRNGSKKIKDLFSEMTNNIYSIDGEVLNESEYGIILNDPESEYEQTQTLLKASEIAIQTGTVSITQMLDVGLDDSLASKRRKLEKAEREKMQREEQARKEELEYTAQAQERLAQLEEQKLELDRYKIDTDNQTKIIVAEISNYFKQPDTDSNNNNIPDPIEIGNFQLDQQKHISDTYLKDKQIEKDRDIELRTLKLKEKEIESKEKIEKAKEALKKIELKSKKEVELIKARAAARRAKKPSK